MKFSVALAPLSLALLAQAVVGQSTSSAAAPSSASSSAAAPSSTSASSSSSSSASSAAGGAGGASQGASTPVATCTLVAGDPRAQPFGCVDGATTSTPPYNSESLQSFLIGGYSAGKEGTAYSEVASKLADSVTQIYPTLTVSYSDIVKQYVTALSASAADYHRDGAVTTHSSSLGAVAVVFAGLVAGGAFIL